MILDSRCKLNRNFDFWFRYSADSVCKMNSKTYVITLLQKHGAMEPSNNYIVYKSFKKSLTTRIKVHLNCLHISKLQTCKPSIRNHSIYSLTSEQRLKDPIWYTKSIISNFTHECLQLRAKQTAPLLNKHYQNEVTLTGQNPPLKFCQSLEILTHFITGLDLSMIEIWSL